MTLNHFDQRPVPATDSTPDSAPPSPPGIASIADALREAARLAAVRDLLAEREQELRAWLEAKASARPTSPSPASAWSRSTGPPSERGPWPTGRATRVAASRRWPSESTAG